MTLGFTCAGASARLPLMRILHLGKYYPPARGGMETVLRLICEGLLDRGHDVGAVVAAQFWGDRREVLCGPASGRCGTLVRAGRLAVINSQPVTPNLLALVRREVRHFRPDLVHLHLPNPLAAATWLTLSAWRGGDLPPLVVWYHADITRQRLGSRIVAPAVTGCLAQAHGITVSSQTLADGSEVLQRWREKVVAIPFGIEPDRWAESPGSGDGPFLFVGRLVHYKGLPLLCAAIAEVPGARLDIIGDGPLRAELIDLIAAQHGRDRIRIVGEVDDLRLRELMAGARALVLPSLDRSETFGLVQLEAMAAGLPVIASRLPTGAGEIVEDGVSGRLVPVGELAPLRAALAELLDDSQLARRWGQAGRVRVQEHYTAAQMVTRLLRWYHEVLARIDHA